MQTSPSKKKKFEVEIYERIVHGEPPMDKVSLEKIRYDQPVIIEAASKHDLEDFAEKLKLCNQTFKIVRIIDDGASSQPVQLQQDPQTTHAQLTQSCEASCQEPSVVQPPVPQLPALQPQKSKPKLYKIGSIEIKDDNGKIYQKQWMRLSEEEAANFRLVSDKSNATVNMSGKHLEMKRWALVESAGSDIADAIEKEIADEEL